MEMTSDTTPEKLIKQAQNLLKKRYENEGHHVIVAAALVSEKGYIYTGLHVGTTQPSIATCAEIIAIGQALMAERDIQIKMIVAVRDKEGYIVSPCGKCREYIADYGLNAQVIVPAKNKNGYKIVSIHELLPNKYEKRTRECK